MQHSVVIQWSELALQAIRVEKPGPPMAARSLAIIHTAMYDAWTAYDDQALGTQLGSALRRSVGEHTPANKRMAIAYAAYRALVDQFPTQQNAADQLMQGQGYWPLDNSMDGTNAASVGNVAAHALLWFRHHDGANQLGDLTASGKPYADTSGYLPRNPATTLVGSTPASAIPHPDRWQPLTYLDDTNTPRTPSFIAPHWRHVTPFALASANEFRPQPPQALLSQGFLEQALWVVELQKNLTDEQNVIAEYWADGPNSELPPGHWVFFAHQAIADHQIHGAERQVQLLFALTNAIFDASIAIWECKRYYDYVRPVTAIRHLLRGKTLTGWRNATDGQGPIQGEAWRTFQRDTFPTPPFPEYVSGHSGFSTAGATVLRDFLQSDAFNRSYTQQAHSLVAKPTSPAAPVTLTWGTFSEAAQQAGESRLYGGIHFYEGNVAGLHLGRLIGARALARARAYWEGQPWE